MTVKELIAKLAAFPPDTLVIIDHDGDRLGDARSAKACRLHRHDKYDYVVNGTGELIHVAIVSGDE